MSKKGIILLLLTGVLALSCGREPYPSGQEEGKMEEPSLGLAVEFPKMGQTKADSDQYLDALESENTIHSLAVWVFEANDSHSLVVYKRIPEEDFPPGGGLRRYSLPISKDFAERVPNVDIFVLANAASIGQESLLARAEDEDPANDPTSAELDGLSFGLDPDNANKDYFGTGNLVREVPNNGLPMSGVSKNCSVQGEAPVLRVEAVRLKRAISRFRIVFCRSSSLDKTVSVNKVTFYGYQIPKREYVFTSGNTGVVYEDEKIDSYVQAPFELDRQVTPAPNTEPENYIYLNQEPESYEKLLNDAVNEGVLTDYGVTDEISNPYFYFRESDLKLSGLIEYSVNGSVHTKEFSMQANGDFARNHTWTLLGVFVSGNNLQLSLRALPWDYNSFTINMNDQAVHLLNRFELDDETVDMEKSKIAGFDWDARLIPGVPAKGYLRIIAPAGGYLQVKPEGDAWAFKVEIENNGLINPKYNDGRLGITITPAEVEANLKGTAISLKFSVKMGEREIEAQTEVENDVYRFVQ
jgi:hypothetical protein